MYPNDFCGILAIPSMRFVVSPMFEDRKQISVLLTVRHDENKGHDFKNPFAIGNKTKNMVVRIKDDVLMYKDPDTLIECMEKK
jgi:hypothetical protein